MKLSILDQVHISPGIDCSTTFENSVSLARLGDHLGYERYWVAEHHSANDVGCSCPEVLLGRIGAETRAIRIGAGGILLPHYSALKVAETFRTLEALYPERIDLGIGRAPGCSDEVVHALKRHRIHCAFAEDFCEQITELLSFLNEGFPPEHPFHRVRVSPQTSRGIPVWLLGSSPSSASTAARFALPYAFAQFICPTLMRDSFDSYRREMSQSGTKHPSAAILAVGAICVERDSDMEELVAVANAGEAAVRADRQIATHTSRRADWQRCCFVGTQEKVVDQLATVAAISKVDEVMVVAPFGSHETRMKSYRLLAEGCGLSSRYDCERETVVS